MDWDRAIERNREALKRVLATLVAMVRSGSRSETKGQRFGFSSERTVRTRSPFGLIERSSGPFEGFERPEGQEALAEGWAGPTTGAGPAASGSSRPLDAFRHATGMTDFGLSPIPASLPRHLHRAVLRLLRPAEAAARRLIIVAAHGLVVTLPPTRPRQSKPDPKAAHAILRSLGIAVVMSPADHARAAAEKRTAAKRAAKRAGASRTVTLPLTDPLRGPRPHRPRTVPAHAAPRILSFDGPRPHRLPPPPAPGDLIDATRLNLRLAALHSALDNLPKHAKRFARWKMRRGNGAVRRISPLRPGRPPGQHRANSRRPAHEVHEVLGDLHHFAFKALQPPDTS